MDCDALFPRPGKQTTYTVPRLPTAHHPCIDHLIVSGRQALRWARRTRRGEVRADPVIALHH